jgi:actin
MNGKELPEINEVICDSIKRYDCSVVRRILYKNIILSGGNTFFEGLGERLQKEIEAKISKSVVVKVIASPDRKYAAWRGGSTLTSLSAFSDKWITN